MSFITTRKSATVAFLTLIIMMVAGAFVNVAYADVLPATAAALNKKSVKLHSEGDAITASFNQDMVDKIDQENRGAGLIIKAPGIEFRCKGGIATTCSDRVMDGVEVKIRKIQSLVTGCQRGVESVSSISLSYQVRQVVDSMPANVKLFVVKTNGDKGDRRSRRQNIDGFCELSTADLSRTPTL